MFQVTETTTEKYKAYLMKLENANIIEKTLNLEIFDDKETEYKKGEEWVFY